MTIEGRPHAAEIVPERSLLPVSLHVGVLAEEHDDVVLNAVVGKVETHGVNETDPLGAEVKESIAFLCHTDIEVFQRGNIQFLERFYIRKDLRGRVLEEACDSVRCRCRRGRLTAGRTGSGCAAVDGSAEIKGRETSASRRLFRFCFRVLLWGRRFPPVFPGRLLPLQGLCEPIGDGLERLGSFIAVDETVLQAIENKEGRDVARIHHGSECVFIAIIRVVAGQAGRLSVAAADLVENSLFESIERILRKFRQVFCQIADE